MKSAALFLWVMGVAFDAGAQTFGSSESDWFELTRGGVPIADPVGEGQRGQPGRDVVGSTSDGALWIDSDADYIYFRLRVDGTPLGHPGFDPYGWACQISIDGDPTDYELMVNLDGKEDRVELWLNNQPGLDDPDDPADVEIAGFGGTSNPSFSSLSHVAEAATTFGGDGDFYADWAIPRVVLPFASTTTPLQLVCGTSSDGVASLTTGVSGDIGGFVTNWHDTATDPVICGVDGCAPCDGSCQPDTDAGVSGPDAGASDSGAGVSEPDAPVSGGEPDGAVSGGEPDAPVSGGEPDGAVSGGEPDGAVSGGEPDAPVSGGEPDGAVSGGEPDAPVSGGGPDAPVSGGGPDAPVSGSGPDGAVSGGGPDGAVSGGGPDGAVSGGGPDGSTSFADARPADATAERDAAAEALVGGYIEGGGCDCRAASASSPARSASWLLGLVALWWLRRRRK